MKRGGKANSAYFLPTQLSSTVCEQRTNKSDFVVRVLFQLE